MPDHHTPALDAARISSASVGSSDPMPKSGTLAYAPPRLTHLGRVRDLTAGANSGALFDGVRSKINP